jgi:heavy metal sensor kinase
VGLFRFIRVRLTLWYVLLLAVLLAAFSVGVYVALRQALYENLNDSLENRASIVTALVTEDGELDAAGVEIPGDPFEGEHFARVFDADGNLLIDNSTPGFSRPPSEEAVSAALAGESSRRHVETGNEDLRVLTSPIRTDSGIVGAVEVAQSEEDVQDTLQLLIVFIAIGYPLTLVLATAGGVLLAGRALAPVDDLTRAAQSITAEDLSRRIDTSGPDDEIGRLARTFDGMIARLDESFQRQRQFTADASHELRTPLTAVKGQIEVALQREREPAEYREVLTAVNSEVDRMARLVGSLLALARADAGQIPLEREQVDIGAVIGDAVAQVRPAAEEKGIALSVSDGPDVSLLADQDLLLQLALNLLDNALKYTPRGGSVGVDWSQGGGEVVLRVSDTGSGIAPEHLRRVFDRFYRVDTARSREKGGAGLGLSICHSIAEAHSGSIDVQSTVGEGSTFIVRLPLA